MIFTGANFEMALKVNCWRVIYESKPYFYDFIREVRLLERFYIFQF